MNYYLKMCWQMLKNHTLDIINLFDFDVEGQVWDTH